jgi:hypothetical protein
MEADATKHIYTFTSGGPVLRDIDNRLHTAWTCPAGVAA